MIATDAALDPLDALLDGTAEALDLPESLHNIAVSRYQDVGGWLSDDPSAPAARLLYPQGSFLLQTVVAPLKGSDYDLDFVLQEPVRQESISQADLKARVGDALHRQLVLHGGEPSAAARCTEGRRCWTLTYPRLHLDVLPALPDVEAPPSGIVLSDREIPAWQYSDPRAYAIWFEQRSQPVLLFKEARAQVEAVPVWRERKTPLQRAVQVIKRHRDQFFVDDLDDRPPSILITTLVGQAYNGESTVVDAVLHAANRMDANIEERDGVVWVANPVQPKENFADKWAMHPARASKFYHWLEVLRAELASITGATGIPSIVAGLEKSWGQEPVLKAAEMFGVRTLDNRVRGGLTVAGGAATLGTGTGVKVRQHGFYGA